MSADIISRALKRSAANRENEKPLGVGELLWKLLWWRVAVKHGNVLVKVS